MFLYERKWTGGLARTDCGRGVFECGVNDEGNLEIEMDIRRCRVQQFRWGEREIMIISDTNNIDQIVPALPHPRGEGVHHALLPGDEDPLHRD